MDLTPSSLFEISQQLDLSYELGVQTAEPYWDKIATKTTSNSLETHYPFLAKRAGLREWIGERAYKNFVGYDYVLKNKKWEDSFRILRDEIEDDRIGMYANVAQEMGYAAALWPDDLVTAALAAGESALCYDGQYFFDTDHPVDPSHGSYGVQANLFTGMPLNAANFQAVYTAMRGFKGEDNRKLRIKPTVLMVPTELQIQAQSVINNDFVVQTQTVSGTGTAVAVKNQLAQSVEILVNPDLTSPTDWYLLDTSKPIKPLIFQERVAPKFVSLDQDTAQVAFERDEFLYGTRARGASGYALWFLAAKVKAT
jgi:phage major head subunit gpT-like protein